MIKDAGIENETIVIATSDHGGVKTLDEVEDPWVITGPGVLTSHQLKSTIFKYDIRATIAWVLGLKVPQEWIGKTVLEAFEKSD